MKTKLEKRLDKIDKRLDGQDVILTKMEVYMDKGIKFMENMSGINETVHGVNLLKKPVLYILAFVVGTVSLFGGIKYILSGFGILLEELIKSK